MTHSAAFIAVISDTHGLLRPEVVERVTGAELIIHAGDYGSMTILDRLALMSGLKVVRGNVDFDRSLPKSDMFMHRGRTFYLVHDVEDTDISPSGAGVDYVIYGHTHRPDSRDRNGICYLNPGSCGPERRGTPVSMAKLYPEDGWRVELIDLTTGGTLIV